MLDSEKKTIIIICMFIMLLLIFEYLLLNGNNLSKNYDFSRYQPLYPDYNRDLRRSYHMRRPYDNSSIIHHLHPKSYSNEMEIEINGRYFNLQPVRSQMSSPFFSEHMNQLNEQVEINGRKYSLNPSTREEFSPKINTLEPQYFKKQINLEGRNYTLYPAKEGFNKKKNGLKTIQMDGNYYTMYPSKK